MRKLILTAALAAFAGAPFFGCGESTPTVDPNAKSGVNAPTSAAPGAPAEGPEIPKAKTKRR